MSRELFNKAREDKGFSIKSRPMGDLVNSFKKALILKEEDMQEFGIAIKDVKLTFKTVAKAEAGAGISLQIPILGKIEFGSEISEKSLPAYLRRRLFHRHSDLHIRYTAVQRRRNERHRNGHKR